MNLADEMRQLVSDYASSWNVDEIYQGCIERITEEAKKGHDHCCIWVNNYNPYNCCDENKKWNDWIDKMPIKVMNDVAEKLQNDGFYVTHNSHEFNVKW